MHSVAPWSLIRRPALAADMPLTFRKVLGRPEEYVDSQKRVFSACSRLRSWTYASSQAWADTAWKRAGMHALLSALLVLPGAP